MISQENSKMTSTPKEIIKEAEDALSNWKKVMKDTQVPAGDLLYYAEELWLENQTKWNEARRAVMSGECTVEAFDGILKALQEKQAPVWDILGKQESELRATIEKSHGKLKLARDDIHKAIKEDPLAKHYMNPLAHIFGPPLHSDQKELLHVFQAKLRRQLEDAEEEFTNICGFPTGVLTRVNNIHDKVFSESTHLQEQVHKKKGVAMRLVEG